MSRKRGQFRLVVFGHGPSHLDALSLWPPMSNQTTKVDIRGGRLGACSSRPPARRAQPPPPCPFHILHVF